MRPVSRWALRAAISLVALVGAGPAGAEVLYDQYNNPGPFASRAQNYEASQNAFDTELADDFVVGAANGWLVNQIEIDGQYFNGPGPASSFNVRFYADVGGLPGSEVAARTNVSFTPGPEVGDVVIALTPGIPLAVGTYWLSVQANQNFVPAGQWGWTDRTIQSNQGAAWRNPGNSGWDRLHYLRQARDDLQRRCPFAGSGLSNLREHRRRGAAARPRPDDDHRRGRRRPPRAGRVLWPRRADPQHGGRDGDGHQRRADRTVGGRHDHPAQLGVPKSSVRWDGDEHDSLRGRGRSRGCLRCQPEPTAQPHDCAGHVPDRPRRAGGGLRLHDPAADGSGDRSGHD